LDNHPTLAHTKVIKILRAAEIGPAAGLAAAMLADGKLVGFATDTVYGIAAQADHAAAMNRLRELKSRPARPFSVHIGLADQVGLYVKDIPRNARRLIDKAWPGPITLLLKVGGKLADDALQRAGLYDVLCSDDTIGIRFPDEPFARAMLSAAGPVVAPSANLAGQPSPRNAGEVLADLDGKIDLLVDSGQTRLGRDSTIISFAQAQIGAGLDDWTIVRKGAMDERTIRHLLVRRIVFVCTGNTCRSPMAAGLAQMLLAGAANCEVGELKAHGYDVSSAGIYAISGGRATPEAVEAAWLLGADITRHRSKELTTELINSADLVFCMTSSQVSQASRLVPSAAGKIRRLDEQCDIADPIGGGGDDYTKTAGRIMRALKRLLDEGTIVR
jgi:tRNA threonylcarbamoyl adenosine modification protein (Sua5/YciO/YrdC/YwlC family)